MPKGEPEKPVEIEDKEHWDCILASKDVNVIDVCESSVLYHTVRAPISGYRLWGNRIENSPRQESHTPRAVVHGRRRVVWPLSVLGADVQRYSVRKRYSSQ